jgi:putative GTP pyrophosphokinase
MEGINIKKKIEEIRNEMNKDQYYLYCQYVMGILTVKIKIIGEQLEHKYNREVIQNVSQRIKTPESIYAKMIRKGLKPDFSVAKEKLNDLIGIRIVCLFVDDVYEIAEMLKNQKDLTLIKEKDYIAKPKKSGYMSLHLIMKVPVCIDNKIETKTVEIQIRTTGMDFWSVLEYQLLYKKNVKGADKIGKELKGYSDEIASLDRKMLKLRNRIEAI